LLLVGAQLFCQAANQTSPPIQLDEQLAEIAQNPGKHYNRAAISDVGRSAQPRAIPTLEDAFDKASDETDRLCLASALVRLGAPDPRYWNYLAAAAEKLLDARVPIVSLLGSDGKVDHPGDYTSAFRQWAKAKGLDVDEAAYTQTYVAPASILDIAAAGDPRGLPILRRSLVDENPTIQLYGAMGLAILRDKSSIRAIIQAAKMGPADMRASFGDCLLTFDDAEAQAAAEQLIPDKGRLKESRQLAKEKGPRSLLP
jgi:hypothetical protein